MSPADDIRRLRDEYMQRARDHRGWGGNTSSHDVYFARKWSARLVRFLRWQRENANGPART